VTDVNLMGGLAGALLLLPVAGFLLNATLGNRLGRRFVNWVGPGVVGLAFVVSVVILTQVFGADEAHKTLTIRLWDWINFGANNLQVGFDVTIDPLAVVMIMVITGVGFLIHVYSVGYMEHDPDIARFFSYMNLFIFSMLLLVLAGDMLILIIGWALVALSSYLLIGFWYQWPSAVQAARKAFITQVIGDVALVLAAFLILTNLHGQDGRGIFSISLPTVFYNAQFSFAKGGGTITLICLLLALGAFAKSAQFPLHTWLPDAMEGPTPVSALIHAATMVTAGVYLIARFHTLFDLSPVGQGFVACVGIGTALMAGVIALSQVDIKRVIAYSTMSQIGLMIFAVGIGAYTAGMFHFVTHAVFKALLFMAAGNVIHAMNDEQDIRLMGGLGDRMRNTERAFIAGSLALAGIPFFAGWFSKEDILGFGTVAGPAIPSLFIVGLVINVLTGLYAIRLWAVVFRGEPQTARVFQAHEPGRTMLWPVMILGGLSVVVGIVLQWPFQILGFSAHFLASFLDPVFASATGVVTEPSTLKGALALALGTVASIIGVGMAYRFWYEKKPHPQEVVAKLPPVLPQLSWHKFYFDELYDAILVRPTLAVAHAARRVLEPRVFDGWVRGVGQLFADISIDFRGVQTGLIRDYATGMLVFAGVFVFFIVWVIAR
jgi:NADH-quinone oxidoreductase subunit L